MTSMIDRPDPPGTAVPDPQEFAQLAAALGRHGITLEPAPLAPGQWISACPICLSAGGDEQRMTIFPWHLPEHAGAIVFECVEHPMYDIARMLTIRTRLITALDEGHAELRKVLAALDARGLPYEAHPSGYGHAHHQSQCLLCIAQQRDNTEMSIYVDAEADGGNSTFGHVYAECEVHFGDTILNAMNIVTRGSLRQTYGAVAWASIDPEPRWLIEPLIEPGQFAVIFGPSGVGKSLLAQEQAFRLAEQGHRVLYLDHENAPAEVKLRRLAMGYLAAPSECLTYLTFPPLSALDTPAGAARLHALVDAAQAEVVFLDTWSKHIEGDEASPSTHTAAYNLAITPLRRQGVTVIALDHTGKEVGRGPRGGSSKVDNVDVLWLLTGKGNGRLRLERRKTRTGRGPDIVELQRHELPLRHERAQQRPADVLTPEVRACIAKLDELDVPPGWGRERALQVLRDNEYKVRNGTLNTAIQIRRGRGNAPVGTLDLTATETPSNGDDDQE